MKFLSRLDDFEHIVIDGSVSGTGLSSLYLKDTATPILRIGNNNGDSFITYDGSELSISSDVDLRLTTPTDQDVFLITSTGNITTTQAGGIFTIGGGLTLPAITGGFLKTDANGVVSVDNSSFLTNETDTLDSVTDRGATTTNAITVGGITVGDSHFIGNETFYDNLVIISSSGENINLAAANGIYFNTNAVSASNVGSNRMYLSNAGNLGIGTTSPNSRLHVSGNILLDNNQELRWLDSGGTQRRILELTSTDLLELESPDRIRLNPGGSTAIDLFDGHNTKYTISSVHSFFDASANEAVRITGTGNVGIGTTSPLGIIDVRGNYGRWRVNGYGGMYFRNDSDTGYTRYIHPRSDGSLSFGRIADTDLSGTDPDKFAASSYDQFYLDSSGTAYFNKGINFAGVNGANFVVDTDGQRIVWEHQRNGTRKMSFYHEADADTFNFNFESGNKLQINGNRIVTVNELGTASASAATDFVAVTGDEMTGRLTLNQNVTIGGATPSNGNLIITDGTNTLGIDSNEIHSTSAMYIGTNSGDLVLRPNGNTTVTNGKLGVGTTSPGYLIEATGTIRATDSSGATGVGGAGLEVRYNTTDGAGSLLAYDRGNSAYKELRLEGSLIAIREAGTEIARFNGGRLGIGTDNADAPLTVTNDAVSSYIINVNMADDVDGGGFYEATGGMELYLKDTSGTGQVKLTSSGSSYLNGGNVGIGTTSPSSRLHVSDATDISMSAGGAGQFAVEGNGYTGAIALDDSAMHIYHNSAARALILGTNETAGIEIHQSNQTLRFHAYTAGLLKTDASGNVSLDTSSYSTFSGDYDDLTNKPTLGTASSSAATDFVAVTGDTMSGGLNIEVSTSNTQLKLKRTTSATGEFNIYTNTDSLFFHNVGQSTYPMMINSSGNVGIGTTSPNAQLELAKTTTWGTLSNQVIYINNNGTGGNINDPHNMGSITWRSGNVNTAAISAIRNTPASGNNVELRFTTATQASGQQTSMTITSGGNVGIGTNSPSEKLDVSGKMIFGSTGSSHYGNAGAFNTASNGDKIIFYNDGTSYDGRIGVGSLSNLWIKSFGETAGEGDIELHAGQSQRVTVKGSGNVGIGNTAPSNTLTVGANLSNTSSFNHDSLIENLMVRGAGSAPANLWLHKDDQTIFDTNDLGSIKFSGHNGSDSVSGGRIWYEATEDWSGSTNSTRFSVSVVDGTNSTTGLVIEPDGAIQLPQYTAGILKTDANGNVSLDTSTYLTSYTETDTLATVTSRGSTTTTALSLGTDSATAGALALTDRYSGNDHIANIGWIQSSGGTYIGYGVKQDGSSDWKSTFDNFSGKRNYVAIDEDSIKIAYASSQQTAVDDVVTLSEKFRFDLANGRLGIGTTSPTTILNLSRTIATHFLNSDINRILIQNPSTSFGGSASGVEFDAGAGDVNAIIAVGADGNDNTPQGLVIKTTTNNPIIFATNSGANFIDTTGVYGEKVRITEDGNVGIGTTDPGRTLDVRGDAQILSTSSTGLRIVGGTTSEVYMIFGDADDNSMGGFGYNNDTNELSIDVNNSEAIRIDSARNVGIGTTNPTAKLNIGSAYNDAFVLTDQRTASNTSTFDSSIVWDAFYSDAAKITLTHNDYSTTYRRLHFDIGGNELMSIKANGSVGIGTDNPGKKLEVRSVIDTESSIRIRQSSYNFWDLKSPASDTGFAIADVGGEKMRITSGGNVGIGTTSPSEKLEVDGNVQIGSSVDAKLYMVSSGGNGYNERFFIEGYADGGTYGGGFKLSTRNDSNIFNTAVTVDRNGNVGIGTTSPFSANGTNLHIQDSLVPRLILDNTATSGRLFTLESGNNGDFLIYDSDGTSTRFLINSSGNVGIGTTSPAVQLHIHNPSSDYAYTMYSNNTTGSTIGNGSLVGIGATEDLLLWNYEATPTLFATSGVERMRILANGNVGIGTTAPGAPLHVVGNILSQSGRVYTDALQGYSANAITLGDGATTLNLISRSSQDIGITGGNVGIGTTTPATKLHVVGTAETRLRVGSSNASSNVVLELRDENTPTGQGTVITYNNATGETYFNNALSTATTDFHFQSGEYGTASDFFTLSNSGGNSILHLKTTSGDSFITYEDSTNELAVASDGDLRLTTPTDQDVFFISSGGNIDMTQAGGTVDMGGNLVVDGDGNFNSKVVIGTATVATPNAAADDLHIKSSGSNGITISSGNAHTGTIFFGDGVSSVAAGFRYNHNTGDMAISAEDNINFTCDKVGIGTTNADTKLQVAGTGSTGLSVRSNTSGDAYMRLYSDAVIEADWFIDRSASTVNFRTVQSKPLVLATNNTEALRITSGGNVGIGTDNPSYKLTVSSGTEDIGILTASSDSGSYVGFLDNATSVIPKVGAVGNKLILDASQYVGVRRTDPSYALDVSGTIRATGDVIAYSDARVKENVETIPNALDKVKAMRGVGYNKIGEEKRSIGVIAQEMLEVMPEVVSQDEQGMYSVAYGNLVGVLIEAMKDQQKQIDELKAQLNGIAS